jgi:hypothetical protein
VDAHAHPVNAGRTAIGVAGSDVTELAPDLAGVAVEPGGHRHSIEQVVLDVRRSEFTIGAPSG